MSYAFGRTSESRLAHLHPDLMRVVRRAMAYQVLDFMVVETLRSPAQAAANAAKGVGIRNSKHLAGPDGKARAVDLAPYPVEWSDLKRFHILAGLMLAAAKEEGVRVRYGGNWDGDNDFHDNSLEDLPHFELA